MHNANNIQIATAACAYCELHPTPQELIVCQSMQFLTLILSLAILHMHYKQRIFEWKSFIAHPADLRHPDPLLQAEKHTQHSAASPGTSGRWERLNETTLAT